MSVIPVAHKGKKPAVPWKRYQKEPAPTSQVLSWFGNGTKRNVGIVTGINGLTVLDFDTMTAYANWLHWSNKTGDVAHMVAMSTFRVETARGVHVYVYLPAPTRTRPLRDHGLDIKGRGGYVLAPPSIHPSGAEYRAPNPLAPILTVEVLSDVLPSAILAQHVSKKVDASSNKKSRTVMSDPWDVISDITEITEGVVDEIKARYKIEDFVPHRRPGRDGFEMARCPFHDDRNPSFWVNIEQQICGCFAGCTDKPLDVINLYARLYDLDNTEAIIMMAREL